MEKGRVNVAATPALRVLIADDQADILLALGLLLKGAGMEFRSATSPDEIVRALERERFDVVLMDLNYRLDTTSGREGLELLKGLETMPQAPPVVVMTAWGTIETAVEAMRLGARDFVLKPWRNDELVATIRKHAARPTHGASGAFGREMEIAGEVQRKLLSAAPITLGSLECAGQCLQAGIVGGDYFDFLPTRPESVVLLMGDISGKGIPAALLMANLQALFRGQRAEAFDDLPSLLESVNATFYERTSTQHYSTLFLGRYEEPTRTLTYVNCGHYPPILLRADGAVSRLAPNATVVGLFARLAARPASVKLDPGDHLVLFSDGVTEALDERGEELGEKGLVDLVREQTARRDVPLPRVLSSLLGVLSRLKQHDDMTLVMARAL